MRIKTFITTACVAMAGIGLSVQSAKAVTYSNGDLFLGFQASGGTGVTSTYLVDIGQASTYTTATGSFNLSLGNIGADLTAIYGANWDTRTDLSWGIAGAVTPALGSDGNRTRYASAAEITPGTMADAWVRLSNSQSALATNGVSSLATAFVNNYSATANSTVAVIEGTSDVNNWVSFQSGGLSFGTYNPSIEGTVGTALDLFRMTTSSTPNLTGTYEGTFSINNSGQVGFSLSPAPEPSTYALIGLGAAFVLILRRRKAITA